VANIAETNIVPQRGQGMAESFNIRLRFIEQVKHKPQGSFLPNPRQSRKFVDCVFQQSR
jgi:hypothetical protein